MFEATQGKQPLLIELEKFSDATLESYDVAAALGYRRWRWPAAGNLVARLEDRLAGRSGKAVRAAPADQNDLPQTLNETGLGVRLSLRRGSLRTVLQVEKVQPRISVTELVDAELNTTEIMLNWQGVYQIEDAGLFQLRVEIPAGFDVRSIQGKAIGDAQPVAVDSYHRVADEGTTWIVNLSKKALGKVGLVTPVAQDNHGTQSPVTNGRIVDNLDSSAARQRRRR